MEPAKLIEIYQQKYQQEQELLTLVDTIASAAADMNAQNYDTLLQSRQQFKEKLHKAVSGTMQDKLPFAY